MHGTASGRVRSVKIAKHQRGVFYTPVVVFQGQKCQQASSPGIRIRQDGHVFCCRCNWLHPTLLPDRKKPPTA